MTNRHNSHAFVKAILMITCAFSCARGEEVWQCHTIDDSSIGADGVRLADVDKDGRLDITTGWEEGGQVRVCFQPMQPSVRKRWPSKIVGKVDSPEDAVFADVNGDGWLDVVSCCEGKEQCVFLHLSPGKNSRNVRDGVWKTQPLEGSKDLTRWMFSEPMRDGSLAIGSKDPNGQIAHCVFDAELRPRLRKIRTCGWIMSLRKFDVDVDGDFDIVYSDRRGPNRGIGWIEFPELLDHQIGALNEECMFLDVQRVGAKPVVVCPIRKGILCYLTPSNDIRQPWKSSRLAIPENTALAKAVALGDIDGNGKLDIAHTRANAKGKVGVFWTPLPQSFEGKTANLTMHDISGTKRGIKFDRIELIDLDQDGDLDLLTCEERDNLGVVWYENPLKE